MTTFCKVQSVLPALSADEVSVCALEDVGGGKHFLEAHLRNSARDGHIRTMSNIPKKGRVLGILEEFVVVLRNSNLLQKMPPSSTFRLSTRSPAIYMKIIELSQMIAKYINQQLN